MQFNLVEMEKLFNETIIELKEYNSDYHEGLLFKWESGKQYLLGHHQNCCERVNLEDVCGDLEDLIGSPIIMAEEVSSEPPEDFNKDNYDSYTWAFYKLGIQKGTVTLRWFGSSNGYYSEAVYLYEVFEELYADSFS